MRSVLVFVSLVFLLAFSPARLLAQAQKDAPNPPPGSPAASSPAAQPPSSPEAQEALAKGQELLFQKHDAKGSLEEFKKVVELDPRYAPGYVMLGNAYMQTGDWTEARLAFANAARLDSRNSVAFLGIGSALNQQHDWTGAQKPLLQSLALNPDSAEANYELGRSFVALGRMQEAELHIVRSIQINKDYALPHILMGDIHLHLHHDAAAALAEYQEYLRLDPEGPSAAPAREIVARLAKLVGQK